MLRFLIFALPILICTILILPESRAEESLQLKLLGEFANVPYKRPEGRFEVVERGFFHLKSNEEWQKFLEKNWSAGTAKVPILNPFKKSQSLLIISTHSSGNCGSPMYEARLERGEKIDTIGLDSPGMSICDALNHRVSIFALPRFDNTLSVVIVRKKAFFDSLPEDYSPIPLKELALR